jgi:hypothetical protein
VIGDARRQPNDSYSGRYIVRRQFRAAGRFRSLALFFLKGAALEFRLLLLLPFELLSSLLESVIRLSRQVTLRADSVHHQVGNQAVWWVGVDDPAGHLPTGVCSIPFRLERLRSSECPQGTAAADEYVERPLPGTADLERPRGKGEALVHERMRHWDHQLRLQES